MGPLILFAPIVTSAGAILTRLGPAASRLMQPIQRMTQNAFASIEPYVGSGIAVTTAVSATKGAVHMGEELRSGDYEGAAITGAITMAEMAGARFVPVPLATGCTLNAAGDMAAATGREIYQANSARSCEIITHLPQQIIPVGHAIAGEVEPPHTPTAKAPDEPRAPIAG